MMRIILAFFLFQVIWTFGQSESKNCHSDHHKIVQPFLGEWNEYEIKNSKESLIGRLSSQLSEDGCVLTQRFVTPDSTFSYKSHGFVNPTTNMWEETYAFNSGRYSKYLWVSNGESLYTLRIGGSRKIDYIQRLRYTDIKADSYLVIQEESLDGGKVWVPRDSTRIKRIQ